MIEEPTIENLQKKIASVEKESEEKIEAIKKNAAALISEIIGRYVDPKLINDPEWQELVVRIATLAPKEVNVAIVQMRAFDRETAWHFVSDEPLVGLHLKKKCEELCPTGIIRNVHRYMATNFRFIGEIKYDGAGNPIPIKADEKL